jgi:hypothetical protein
MGDEEAWRWEYDPDAEHVAHGFPQHIVDEVEPLAAELVALAEVGVDVTDIGEGPRRGVPGGVRRIPLLSDGWFYALPVPRLHLIAITRIIPPFDNL